ncbi:DNA polymerase III subunit delta [Amylibacter marinus]|uniref:DNA-directed DNA polymerase n=1 Tax=Amylibacter marinus TaxID=1475483 RepID=A0ABQ5VW42_9RHOB|nr:DNA polymerase III subunit delta [Amylibacter marinus]GLQ35402.1 DNA polymerase III subunit delta [Amylibacter marinus]
MKLAGPKANAYFAKPDPAHHAILIFGNDSMRVALRRQELILALVGKNADEEMRLTRISAAELRKEPALVLDGLKASGFFPGPRVVFVEDAGDGLTKTIQGALDDWCEGDATLVVTAGQLNARSKLRKVFEPLKQAMAIGIYNDPPTPDEIIQTAQKAGLKDFELEGKNALLALGRQLDPGDLQQTIEKLALYKLGDDTPVSVADITECTPASIDAGLDEVLHMVAEGRSGEVVPVLKRLFGQGHNPTSLCIMATRHFRTLHAAACHPQGPDTGLARARPPVFGPRKDRMVRQARSWGGAKLEVALTVLMDTDLALRSSQKAPELALVERAFIRLAMLRPK